MQYPQKVNNQATSTTPKPENGPPFGDNPYPSGTAEHSFWERYQAAYLSQPASAQLYELQSQIRSIWTSLGVVRDAMDASPNRDACSEHLESLVAAMDELEALAGRMLQEPSAA